MSLAGVRIFGDCLLLVGVLLHGQSLSSRAATCSVQFESRRRENVIPLRVELQSSIHGYKFNISTACSQWKRGEFVCFLSKSIEKYMLANKEASLVGSGRMMFSSALGQLWQAILIGDRIRKTTHGRKPIGHLSAPARTELQMTDAPQEARCRAGIRRAPSRTDAHVAPPDAHAKGVCVAKVVGTGRLCVARARRITPTAARASRTLSFVSADLFRLRCPLRSPPDGLIAERRH